MKKLEGVLAPLVTNFYDNTGELDIASFAANVRAHLAAGLHGVLVAGSTGEAALLDSDERAALVDAARELTPKDKWLLVGTGAESTRNCLNLTKDAAKRGADAALAVAPHYYGNAMTTDALRMHYRRLADESPIPVMIYTIPKYMHFAISAELVAELAQHPNVIGMKDSSGNKDLLAGYMKSASDNFAVFVGSAQWYPNRDAASEANVLGDLGPHRVGDDHFVAGQQERTEGHEERVHRAVGDEDII